MWLGKDIRKGIGVGAMVGASLWVAACGGPIRSGGGTGGAGAGAGGTGMAGQGAAGTGAAGTGAGGTAGGAGSSETAGSSGTGGGIFTPDASANDAAGDGATCTDPTDSDADGTPDCQDGCPFDKNKIAPGICGCGTPDNDSLGDGKIDCIAGRFYEAEQGVLSQVGAASDGGVGGFVVGADPAASNGHFIAAPDGITSTDQPGDARAAYDLTIKKDDAYVIWGRLYTPDRLHDCVWARVDGGNWTKWWDTTGEEWFWYTLHVEADWTMPIVFQLTAGHHGLELANCSDKTKVDRLYVVAGGDVPAGNQSMCNPPHAVEMGGQCVQSCGQLGGTSCDPTACSGHTLLPAYDCAVCCNPASTPPPDGGDDGGDASQPADADMDGAVDAGAD